MGEGSGGRSATCPTFFNSKSVRTMIDLQNGHEVCTALDQRNSTAAPQFGQLDLGWLIWALEPPHLDCGSSEFLPQVRRKIPVRSRAAAENVQA